MEERRERAPTEVVGRCHPDFAAERPAVGDSVHRFVEIGKDVAAVSEKPLALRGQRQPARGARDQAGVDPFLQTLQRGRHRRG